ncbi:MAG: GWxTD domain-containing protein [Bacteroidetes bacterium]|nr:GWxTD domain-containing protein [Bacteroidota bacterium]
MKRLALIWCLLGAVLYAQVEYSARAGAFGSVINFSVDYANYKSAVPNKSRVDVFVKVPYSSIQFVKKENSYHATYDVTLTFLDESKKNVLFERIWKERVKSDDFDQTLSKNNFNLSYKSYDMNPGKYFLKCIIEDSESRKTSFKEIPLTVRQISDTLGMSDVMFISDVVKDSTGEKIIPNVSTFVTNKTDSLSFFFTIYSNKARDIVLEYSMNELKSGKSFKQDDPRTLKAGNNLIRHTIKNANFSLGDYTLKVALKNKDWKDVETTEKKFYSIIYGVPNTITDLDLAVDEMLYIATPEELDFIKDAKTYDEKLNRFLAYWDKKKPNPKIEENPILYEYYRRIEYANKTFKGFGAGWHSDMGMVYVTFGPPSYVERHPMDPDAKPYEIWDYYDLNRSFVFSDQTGFGDYRLVNPDYSRWPGYRQ